MCQRGNARQEFGRRQSVGARLFHAMADLLFQSRDADFKKFVEVGTHDAQELQSFQQRDLLVLRQIQHPAIKFQRGSIHDSETIQAEKDRWWRAVARPRQGARRDPADCELCSANDIGKDSAVYLNCRRQWIKKRLNV